MSLGRIYLSVSSKVGGRSKRLLSLRYSFYNEVEKHLVKLVVELVPISIEYIGLSDLYLVVVARGLISRYDTRIALGSYCY